MSVINGIDVDTELAQYVETALWSSHDDVRNPEGDGPMLDANYGPEDIAPDALKRMRDDLGSFLNGPTGDAGKALTHRLALDFWLSELGEGQIGHDFWLTRNGHGAGFRDRFNGGQGESFGRYLTQQAKSFGECHVYAADDGTLDVS